MRGGAFRDDLYYRLAGAHLEVPPLRERRDLAWLEQKMLRAQPQVVRLSAEAEHCLRHHAWPGNMRELRTVLDYAAAMAAGCGVIGLAELPDALLARGDRHAAAPSLTPEAQLLLQYLHAARWNVSAVAHQLGVARMTVYRRMKRWGIREPARD